MNGSQRAPHKPLLILFALGKLQRENQRLIPYSEIDGKLTSLLREFGPSRKSYHPNYPFWRLQKDHIWEIPGSQILTTNKSGDVNKSDLIQHDIHGGLSKEVYHYLLKRRELIPKVAFRILDAHFEATLHEDILSAVGLSLEPYDKNKKKRDPEFREKVLSAYEYKCAVCNYNVRINNSLVGLEAAHIQWHKADGPDDVENGLALCSLHHKLFDYGIFTIGKNHTFLISEKASGYGGFSDLLLQHHSQNLNRPIRTSYEPAIKYIDWHHSEVFKSPAREIV